MERFMWFFYKDKYKDEISGVNHRNYMDETVKLFRRSCARSLQSIVHW
ncbi:MAG: hypothetical protein ACK444_04440 [Flavobacteriales bacterium]